MELTTHSKLYVSKSGIAPRVSDVAAILVLAAVALIECIPALRSEMLANGDTPVHLSEIRDLARLDGNGWSEIGFCGFPLSSLQPPLTFGGLAMLTRLGLPLEFLFRFAVVASLIVPAFVFYVIARKRLNAGFSLALAATLPLYRASITGEASALSGMFSFYFAAAALWALADVLVRPTRALRDVAIVAMLVGFIGASHMYVTIGLGYLAAVHAGWSLRDRQKLGRLAYDVPGFALGALAAACYWLPNLLARTSADRIPESLGRIATRLLTSSGQLHEMPLTIAQRLTIDPIFHIDAALQLITLVLAVLGARAMQRSTDDLPRYGITLAIALIGGMVLAHLTSVPLIGPTGTRLVYVAKMGILASSFPLLGAVSHKISETRLLAVAAAGAIGFSFLPLRIVANDSLSSANLALRDAENMWEWIRTHHDGSWGRLYVQDTFVTKIRNPLETSHVLVRTAELTGVEQVGAYYGLTPYAKAWLAVDPLVPGGISRAKDALDRANITHLLVLNAGQIDLEKEQVTELARYGQFALLARNGVQSKWSAVLNGSGTVQLERLSPGKLRIVQTGAATTLAISESYHPFWKAESTSGTPLLSADSFGLMRIELPPSEGRTIDLVYAPPVLPWLITILAGVSITGLFLVQLPLQRLSGWRISARPAAQHSGPAN